ncbi:nardilysin-like [Clytia hemisphaerica]
MFKELIKSPSDYRDYRILNLENGIKVLLISDINHKDDGLKKDRKETKEAAAAFNINVGSFQDPSSVEGLAHFLEHMVFMGSEKYPAENDFSAYLKQHAGDSNAYTDYENTVFYFHAQPEGFEGALDRFAQFFINPLLLEDAVGREIKAVDSEFNEALPDDYNRLEQLFCHMAKKDHPLSSFLWGNKESIINRPKAKGIDVMKELRKFFETYYLTCQTSLAIISTESLDTLEEWCKKYFSGLGKRNSVSVQKLYSKPFQNPFELEKFHKIYYVKPVADQNLLQLEWIISSDLKDYGSSPTDYIVWLLNHKSKGSLHPCLLNRGYISSLCASCNRREDYAEFYMDLYLTNSGIGHIEEIVILIFQYLAMLKRDGPSERIFNEIRQSTEIAFRYVEPEEPEDLVENIVVDMQHYPEEHWIKGKYGAFSYKPEVIAEMLNMLTAETVNIVISSKILQHLAEEETEPWFKTEYSIKDIPESWIDPQKYNIPNKELHLPSDNPYLATEFNIKALHKKKRYPSLIHETKKCKVWHKQDDRFLLPKAIVHFKVQVNHFGTTGDFTTSRALANFANYYVFSEMRHEANLAQLAQNNYHSIEEFNVISVQGFNHKLLPMFKKYIDSLVDFKLNETIFELAKQDLRRGLRNDFICASTLKSHLYDILMYDKDWDDMHVLQNLEKFDCKMVQDFADQYWNRNHTIECLLQGNLLEEEVKEFVEYLQLKLPKSEEKFNKDSNSNETKIRMLNLPKGRTVIRHLGFNKKDPNTVIENYYQMGPITMRYRTLCQILSDMMSEQVFDYLRTREQLGYYVGGSYEEDCGILGFSFIVQTQKGKFRYCKYHQVLSLKQRF